MTLRNSKVISKYHPKGNPIQDTKIHIEVYASAYMPTDDETECYTNIAMQIDDKYIELTQDQTIELMTALESAVDDWDNVTDTAIEKEKKSQAKWAKRAAKAQKARGNEGNEDNEGN